MSVKSTHKIPQMFSIALLQFHIQVAAQAPIQVMCRGLEVCSRGLLEPEFSGIVVSAVSVRGNVCRKYGACAFQWLPFPLAGEPSRRQAEPICML